MKQEDIDAAVRPLVARLATFEGGFALVESDRGKTVISTVADSVAYLGSRIETVDVDGDGEPDERIVHWVNIRLGSVVEERPHVRKVVAYAEDPYMIILTCEGGREVWCINVDEGFDGDTLEKLRRWQALKVANLDAYNQIGENLLHAALELID